MNLASVVIPIYSNFFLLSLVAWKNCEIILLFSQFANTSSEVFCVAAMFVNFFSSEWFKILDYYELSIVVVVYIKSLLKVIRMEVVVKPKLLEKWITNQNVNNERVKNPVVVDGRKFCKLHAFWLKKNIPRL